MAAPFDPASLTVGGAVGVLDDVMQALNTPQTNLETGAAQYAFSATGHLYSYVTGGIFRDAENTLVWTDRKGNQQPLAAPPRAYVQVRMFPGEQRVVASMGGLRRQLWLWSLPAGPLTPIPFDGAAEYPLVTGEGRELVFSGTTKGRKNLWRVRSDGGAPAVALTTNDRTQIPGAWSAKDDELILNSDDASNGLGHLGAVDAGPAECTGAVAHPR